MYTQYQKVKNAAKHVEHGKSLSDSVLKTLKTISDVVGGTLGPGGKPVLIERYEPELPPIVTKDGVTVFKNLGFEDSVSQTIFECARDVAIKTGISAGDGTTTATILSYALVEKISEFCKNNPTESPQQIGRQIEQIFIDFIEPLIQSFSVKIPKDDEESRKILHGVALVSANHDIKLADAVMECFDLVGDEGNVTITEGSGAVGYQVEKINGYMVPKGFEDSCIYYYPSFINDVANQRVYLEKPTFLLYFGKITELGTVLPIINKAASEKVKNIVLMATGFSEGVLAALAHNFAQPQGVKEISVYPLEVPLSPQMNGQLDTLKDISAITGATIFDPLNRPVEKAEIYDLGPGVEYFESMRFKSYIVGYATGKIIHPKIQGSYEDLLFLRIEELKGQLRAPESEHDKILLQERLAKVSDGIAKLKVVGSSNAEIKEKKDRAEDAICAVRGAIKHGCLPGGAYIYQKLSTLLLLEAETWRNNTEDALRLQQKIIDDIIIPAFSVPFTTLLTNAGLSVEKQKDICDSLIKLNGLSMKFTCEDLRLTNPYVYDIVSQKTVPSFSSYLLDATPAVLEAIRNAISIANILGTLGGAVVFRRNEALEREEASKTIDFLKTVK
jgi:chaperonin GroEL